MTSNTITRKPFSLELVGPAYKVFQEACLHIRAGYVINKDITPEIMPATGQAIIKLVLGCPEPFAETDAAESIELALAQEQAEFDRQVAAAAKRIVEEEKAEAVRKRLKAEAAEHIKAMAKLEKELATAQTALATV